MKLVIASLVVLGLCSIGCAVGVTTEPEPIPFTKVNVPVPVFDVGDVTQFHSAKEQCALDHGAWCTAPNGLEDCWAPKTCTGWANPLPPQVAPPEQAAPIGCYVTTTLPDGGNCAPILATNDMLSDMFYCCPPPCFQDGATTCIR